MPGVGVEVQRGLQTHNLPVLLGNRTTRIHQNGTSGHTGGTQTSYHIVRTIEPQPRASYHGFSRLNLPTEKKQ